MGIGIGIFLIAVGAILTFAVEASVSGLDIAVVGVLLPLASAHLEPRPPSAPLPAQVRR